MDKPPLHFYIDVVGTCNLRCPSCPVGNMPERVNERGVMSPELLDRILTKATSECQVTNVGLFNWTEPLLHPRLDEMVKVVRRHGLPCAVSTNLNINKPGRYRKLLEAAPTILRVSLSGWSQETYGLTHKGGGISNVRKNLEELLNIRDELEAPTRVAVAFQRYLSNLHEEDEIKAFCEARGLLFLPINALMLPLEKLLAYCGEKSFGTITPEDDKVIANLALPLGPALASAANAGISECKLLEQQVTLNWKGDALLCCAVYDDREYFVGNYLECSIADMQAIRRQHAMCSPCLRHGVSNYVLYNVPDMERLVAENIRQHTGN